MLDEIKEVYTGWMDTGNTGVRSIKKWLFSEPVSCSSSAAKGKDNWRTGDIIAGDTA